MTSRSYRPPAGTETRRPTTSDGSLTSRPSTASTWYGASVHTWTAPLSVLITRTRATSPSATSGAVTTPSSPLSVRVPL